MVQTTSIRGDVAYAMPFEPYDVQAKMMQRVTACLSSSSPPTPIVAVEVPTGCGKTLALLSSVLRYQATLEQLTPHELEEHMCKRRWRPCGTSLFSSSASTSGNRTAAKGRTVDETVTRKGDDIGGHDVDEEEQWRVPPLFLKRFATRCGKQRPRADMDGMSSDLRRQHEPPPCTVFYVTRTHAQLRQTVGELRKLRGLQRLKMNILGSRERYCINPIVQKAQANKTLPVEGNNLGEVCDKLVSLGHCEAVHNYSPLASKAINRVLCRDRKGTVWDMEDLVSEGVASQGCPYYAARDLVFFAHINFATYQYLLDPLIRHECKMEAALRNYSVIVFDEAHNVPQVCQDALSLETSVDALHLVMSELDSLISPTHSIQTLSYPREFKLTQWTLVELFSLLYDLFSSILVLVEKRENCTTENNRPPNWRVREKRSRKNNNNNNYGGGDDNNNNNNDDDDDEGWGSTGREETLVNVIHSCIVGKLCHTLCEGGQSSCDTSNFPDSQTKGLTMFRQVYGLVMSLGVTFNPFQFSVFGLSVMKRWLLVMRFILQKPNAFAVNISDDSPNRDNVPGKGAATRRTISIRCLDSSLTFSHLLHSTHRIVLASGTLGPFDQLGRELGIPPTNMMTYEGLHVVKAEQYRLDILTHSMDASRLHCNYRNLSNASFIDHLVSVIVALVEQVVLGGVLLFLPNYSVMDAVGSRILSHYRSAEKGGGQVPEVFLETKSAAEFPAMLDAFRQAASRGTAVLASVYRARVSEGIDFADSMARLVLCVGIPFRPLKLWSVVAQRRYSGEEWYITDALRATNQALGRCVRNRHDYGVMVLLDDRFAHETTQQRLPRWCRERLNVYNSVPSLAKELQSFYHCQVARLSSGPYGRQKQKQLRQGKEKLHYGTSMELSERFVDDMGGGSKVSIISNSRKPHSHTATLHPFATASVEGSRVTTCSHEWSCTAVKLLYEAHDSVEEVSSAHLREALHLLDGEYMGPCGEGM